MIKRKYRKEKDSTEEKKARKLKGPISESSTSSHSIHTLVERQHHNVKEFLRNSLKNSINSTTSQEEVPWS